MFFKKKSVPQTKITKTAKVLEHLQTNGSITSWEAIEKYGATRVADIIYRLREHYDIATEIYEHTDRYGNKTTYAKYVYVGESA